MPRRATAAEATEFEKNRIQTHRGAASKFRAMADGDVWVMEAGEADLSREGVIRLRVALSTWCSRNGYQGSLHVEKQDGAPVRALLRITKGEDH